MKKISFLSFKYNFSCLLFFLSGSSITNLNSLDLPKNIYMCVRQSQGGGGSVCKTKMRKKITFNNLTFLFFFLHKYCCKYIKKISILSGKHHFCPSINFWIKKASRTLTVPPHPPFLFLFLFHKNISWHFFFFFAKIVGNNPSLVPRNIGANL